MDFFRFLPRCARALFLCAAALVLSACERNSQSLRVSGQIQGHPISVGSRVGGRISDVPVREGQQIKKGDVLFRIESAAAGAELAAAWALLAQATAQLQKLEAGPRAEEVRAAEAAAASAKAQYDQALAGARSQEIDSAHARADAARAELANTQDEYERQTGLYKANVGPFAAMDQAKHRRDAAMSTLKSVEKELDLLVQGTRDEQITVAKASFDAANARFDELKNGSRPEDVAAALAVRDQAEAQVRGAEVALAEMTVSSPADGVVETLDLRPGDIVKAGAAARVIDPDDLEITFYISADFLGQVAVGEPVTFTTDSPGSDSFQGEIVFIATEGEFTPRNLQTQEDRVQQVFAVKVRTRSAGGKLRPGMTATVEFPRR
jgi:multidrug resistance efflux pump